MKLGTDLSRPFKTSTRNVVIVRLPAPLCNTVFGCCDVRPIPSHFDTMLVIPMHRIPRRPVIADAIVVASLYVGWAAHAQTPSCEQFKAKLTARIAGGSGPFHVTSVPSGETIPADGRVVGNCGGGKWTLVLLAGVAVPLNPASASVREPRESQPPEQTVASPAAVAVDAQPTVAAASESSPAIASESMPTPVQSAAPASTALSAWNPPAFETLMWVAGVAVSLVLVVAGRWIAYRSRYDAAGLPRGPRLR